MEKVSIIIPSVNEKYLDRTVEDLKAKAEGEIEIIVIKDRPMRMAINEGASKATGKYIMKIDAHCIVGPGFDTILKRDHKPNWIQVPRRYKLDEDTWTPDFNDFIDYEYWIWPFKYKPPGLHGYKWRERTGPEIDDILTFQGSFWFMTREWWNKCDFMNDNGYNELHAQEAAYLGNTTWFNGGRVVVNKNTWYSHLHKKKGERGYHMDDNKRKECYNYSYKHWVHDNKEKFVKLIEKFEPLPNWPTNWRDKL